MDYYIEWGILIRRKIEYITSIHILILNI